MSPNLAGIGDLYQVAIGDHGYVITPAKYQRETVPLQRQATDESVEPGEQSLNIQGAWLRSQDNWFLGAGQLYLDNRFGFISVYVHSGETPSVRTRFWRSKGINPWTEGALSLLPEYQKLKTGTTNPLCCAVGTRLFYWDGAHLYASTNLLASSPTWTTITFPTTAVWPTIHQMTTDGARLYIAAGTYGLVQVAKGASAATFMRPVAPTPSASYGGTPGSTHYKYALVAHNGNYTSGYTSLIGVPVVVTNGNATLSATNFIRLEWTSVTGVSSWDVLVTVSTVWKAVAFGVSGTTFVDVGGTRSAYTLPTPTTRNFHATFVCYGNSWLLAGNGPTLVSVNSVGAVTTIFTHFNTSNFKWVTGTGSPGAIYVGGNSGNVSELFGIVLTKTTFGLTAPYIAGQLTNGEILYDLVYYEDMVIMATSLGVRTSQPNNATQPTLTSGSVITNLGGSRAVVAWATYVWFGISTFNENDGIWTGKAAGVNTGGTIKTSGTGRLFMSEFSTPLVPAFTSDVMAPNGTTGTTTSVTIVQGKPVFCIATKGLYGPYSTGKLVAYGYEEAGWVRYGTIQTKILISATVRHDPLPAGASVLMEIVPFVGTTTTPLTLYPQAASTGAQRKLGTTAGTGSAPFGAIPANAKYALWSSAAYTQTTGTTQPAPDDKGLEWFVGTLTGKCFIAGTWTAKLMLASSASRTGKLIVRFYRHGSTYNLIKTLTATHTITSTPTVFTLTGATAAESAVFGVTTRLYADVTFHPSTGAAANVTVNLATSELITPGYAATGPYALTPSDLEGTLGEPISAGNYVGEGFQVVPVLKRATTQAKGPVLRRWTSRAQVISVRQTRIMVPILWSKTVVSPSGDGVTVAQTLAAEWTYLKALLTGGTAFTYQEGGNSYTCFIDQIELVGIKWSDTRQQIEGLLTLALLTVN